MIKALFRGGYWWRASLFYLRWRGSFLVHSSFVDRDIRGWLRLIAVVRIVRFHVTISAYYLGFPVICFATIDALIYLYMTYLKTLVAEYVLVGEGARPTDLFELSRKELSHFSATKGSYIEGCVDERLRHAVDAYKSGGLGSLVLEWGAKSPNMNLIVIVKLTLLSP